MAQAIKGFSKKRFKYDWKRWTDGRTYRAVKGVDFSCDPTGFGSTLYSKAHLLGIRVKVSVLDDAVEFQFHRG